MRSAHQPLREARAVVSFHGGPTTRRPPREGEISSRILVCRGSADPFVTREHRAAFEEEMTAAKADWRMLIHGGALHGFGVANGLKLNPHPR